MVTKNEYNAAANCRQCLALNEAEAWQSIVIISITKILGVFNLAGLGRSQSILARLEKPIICFREFLF